MELREFVAQAITQITEGICEAQSATKDKGAIINPPIFNNQVNLEDKKNYTPQTIRFDISVSVESESSTGGKGKIQIAAFGAELGKSSGNKDTSMSRISFAIPVCWPSPFSARQEEYEPSVQIAPGTRMWDQS